MTDQTVIRRSSIPRQRRALPPDDRRAEILAAAFEVFARQGFAAARLDDIAKRAQVAKGTIYLHFHDKEDLFFELVRGAAAPLLKRLSDLAAVPDFPIGSLLSAIFALFRSEILATNRKEILRLVIAEGPRFPRIAAFYYEEVVAKGLQIMRDILQRADQRGELREKALVRHPQLVFAPLIVTVVWDALFGRLDPLDVDGLLKTHLQLLTAGVERAAP
jgi:AcrR family transcriptional regulator